MSKIKAIFASSREQIKQFHDRMSDQQTAWIFCWGYLTALKHNKIISENQYKALEEYNVSLWILP